MPYGDSTFALPLAGRRSNLSSKAFRRFGTEVGLPATAVDRAIEEVLAATADVIDVLEAGAIGWDAGRVRDLTRTLRRRRRDLGD